MRKAEGSLLLRAAVGLFVIGLIALLVLFLMTPITGESAPLFVYLLTMCAPLGFLLGLIFALRSGRRQRDLIRENGDGSGAPLQ
jgi:peptidoglycan/LPS O-acetylase OafA/YrhL